MKQHYMLFFIIAILFMSRNGNANDCHSELSAFLKPIYSGSSLKWALEATLSAGKMDNLVLDRTFNNQMLLLGLDYSAGAHQLYFEGGAKFWNRSDEDEYNGGNSGSTWSNYSKPEKNNWGLRELFYGNYQANSKIKAGLQSMRLGNSMILDERVLGISLNQKLGAFDIDFKIGTVSTDFSRQGDFCGKRHVNRLFRGGRFNLVSADLWETNFIGALITFDPSYEKPVENANKTSDDSFSDDSFSDDFSSDDFSSDGFDDFSEFEEPKKRLIKSISLVLFEEFGSGFHDYKYYFGLLAKLSLPALVELETEILYQYIKDEKAFAYRFQLSRDWTWPSGALTNLSLSYLGEESIDDNTKFYSAFSNLLMGEVMQLDVLDLPFWTISVKHDFPIMFKPSIKVFYLEQTETNHLNEWDFQLSAHFFKGFRVYATYSTIVTDLLEGHTDMIRLETKWAF